MHLGTKGGPSKGERTWGLEKPGIEKRSVDLKKKFKKHEGLSRFIFCYIILFSVLPFFQFFRFTGVYTGVYTALCFPTALWIRISHSPIISARAAPATLLVSPHNFENCRDIAFKTLDHTKFLRSYEMT